MNTKRKEKGFFCSLVAQTEMNYVVTWRERAFSMPDFPTTGENIKLDRGRWRCVWAISAGDVT
jgi:hypothetical protein